MIGRPAPDFVGDTLTPGGWLPLGGLRQTPIAMLFFHPGGPFAAELAREFNRFHNSGSMAPTRFMGLVHDSPEAIQQFQRVHGFNLPILRDPGSIGRSYGIGSTPTVVLLDVDHIVRFRLDGFVGAEFRPRLDATEAALRRLPDQRAPPARSIRLEYGEYPRMPNLIATALEGGPVHLVETRGRVIVLMFLDSDCSWCGDRLAAVMEILEKTDPGEVSAVAVVIGPPGDRAVRLLSQVSPRLRILIDRHQATAIRLPDIEAPELLVLDREGFIRYRAPRAAGDGDEFIAQFRRQLASVVDDTPPPSDGTPSFAPLEARVPHVGDNVCRECHQAEYLQWRSTPHAAAISRLVQADRAGDKTCIPCHTTGAGMTAGFGHPLATASMTNVQCEACHGPGFDHVSAPEELRRHTIYGLSGECDACDIERLCIGCHDAENDPDFDLATALPKVSH
jgi:peroxiredoxin